MNNVRIARSNTRADWTERREQLTQNPVLWGDTFDSYFQARLDSRYFDPITKINPAPTEDPSGQFDGEGFAIVAILCSLVEFLETCRSGSLFAKGCQSNAYPAVAPNWHYDTGTSARIFNVFLTSHLNFTESQAHDFYVKVRCAVLHNAKTDDPWVIRVAPSGVNNLVGEDGDKTVLYRNVFVEKLRAYVTSYRTELLSNSVLQDAFIRKFNTL